MNTSDNHSVGASAPEPTATALAIISNVVVVGETASYSPDGTMLAFSQFSFSIDLPAAQEKNL